MPGILPLKCKEMPSFGCKRNVSALASRCCPHCAANKTLGVGRIECALRWRFAAGFFRCANKTARRPAPIINEQFHRDERFDVGIAFYFRFLPVTGTRFAADRTGEVLAAHDLLGDIGGRQMADGFEQFTFRRGRLRLRATRAVPSR